MDINITTDMDLVREILITPDIWERAAEQGQDKDSFYPGYDKLCVWLLCVQNHTNIGIILLHSDTCVSLKMHLYLIKEHRKKGKEMMILFYKWVIDNTNTVKVNASIPDIYPEVIKFAKNLGFRKEGFNRDSWKHDGKISGQVNLGITRSEIEGLI